MSTCTPSRLQGLMLSLDSLASNMREEMMFDEAEIVDDCLPFLALLVGSGLLAPEPDADPNAETIPADMNILRQKCAEMKDLQARLLALKAEASELRMPLDDLRMKQIPALMEELEVKTATFSGIGRVQVAPDLYASTKKGKKLDAMQWLRDLGYEGMISETYNASSLKALFRRQIKEGEMPPDEIFSVTPFVRASIVKA